MKNLVLALNLIALLSGTAALADTVSSDISQNVIQADGVAQSQVSVDKGKPIVLNVPAHKSRKRLLVNFGLFGMGFRLGWMKPKYSNYPEMADKVHGVGYPILNFSAGHHAIGLGTK